MKLEGKKVYAYHMDDLGIYKFHYEGVYIGQVESGDFIIMEPNGQVRTSYPSLVKFDLSEVEGAT